MKKLYTTLIDKTTKDAYIEEEHYKYFNCEKSSAGGKNTITKLSGAK